MNKNIFLLALLFVASTLFTGCGLISINGTTIGQMGVATTQTQNAPPIDPNDPSVNDEGVVINGIRWATRNVDAPGTFAASPESAGMLFQWNRRRGWDATGNVRGWNATGATDRTWSASNDPCPPGWRVPTENELFSLATANVGATLNGVSGRLFGTAPNQIFLPAVGRRFAGCRTFMHQPPAGTLLDAGLVGYYWGRESNGNSATTLTLDGSRITRGGHDSAAGHSVRCVAIN